MKTIFIGVILVAILIFALIIINIAFPRGNDGVIVPREDNVPSKEVVEESNLKIEESVNEDPLPMRYDLLLKRVQELKEEVRNQCVESYGDNLQFVEECIKSNVEQFGTEECLEKVPDHRSYDFEICMAEFAFPIKEKGKLQWNP